MAKHFTSNNTTVQLFEIFTFNSLLSVFNVIKDANTGYIAQIVEQKIVTGWTRVQSLPLPSQSCLISTSHFVAYVVYNKWYELTYLSKGRVFYDQLVQQLQKNQVQTTMTPSKGHDTNCCQYILRIIK